MEDQKEVELFIFENLSQGQDLSFVADELLKLWVKDRLSVSAKRAAAQFCISCGYLKSLLEALKHDLFEGKKTYWPLFYFFVTQDSKELNDAFLTAAAKDNQLLELALFAKNKSKDPRWDKLIKKSGSESQKIVSWPELKQRLLKLKPQLDANTCLELAVGLSEMGLHDLALEVLNYHKDTWTQKEELLEIDFLLRSHHFVEALEKSQNASKKYVTDAPSLKAALYYSAQAYYGLNDKEQALAILKAIQLHDPDYKDLTEMIRIWERSL